MIPVELFSSDSPARCCRVMLLSQVLVLVPSFSTTSLPEPGRCFHSHRLAAMRRTRAGGEALPVLLGPSHPPAMCWKSKKIKKIKKNGCEVQVGCGRVRGEERSNLPNTTPGAGSLHQYDQSSWGLAKGGLQSHPRGFRSSLRVVCSTQPPALMWRLRCSVSLWDREH